MRSWLVRGWLLFVAAQTLFFMAVSGGDDVIKYEALAVLLGTFPLLWSTIIIVFTAGAVSSESGVVADSILSKAIRRRDYILAKLLARLAVVLGMFALATVPSSLVIIQNAQGDMDTLGFAWAYVMMALMLILITSLAVTFSTLFDRTLVAVMVVWGLWYVAGNLTALFGLDFLSPTAITNNLPALIEGDYDPADVLKPLVGYVGLSALAVTGALLHFTRKDV